MTKVTVLMTVYNGMPYLPLAVESILNQTFSDFEFLIVNDYSTDQSREIILSYNDKRIRLLDNEINVKQTRSLNIGLANAKTELVARMDADDVSHPERLQKQVAFMEANENVGVVGSNLNYIDENGHFFSELIRPSHDLALRWMMFFQCPISNGSAMFRRDLVWDKLKGYDESIIFAQDWELWSRIPPCFKLGNLPEKLLDVRVHQTQFGKDPRSDEEGKNIARRAIEVTLGINDNSARWNEKLEILSKWLVETQYKKPELLIETVEYLYGCYCEKFPEARKNREVSRYLGASMFKGINSCGLPQLPIAFKGLKIAWGKIPFPEYLIRIIRWPFVNMGFPTRRIYTKIYFSLKNLCTRQ